MATMAESLSQQPPRLAVVCAASRMDVLLKRLAASPCLQAGGLRWQAVFNAPSAADAFNPVMQMHEALPRTAPDAADWLVWTHQDVYLPEGWEVRFASSLQAATQQWPSLDVAGVYGVRGHGASTQRCGQVLDRGQTLNEPAVLPCTADSLDELLIAVRVGSGLRMDASLGFDFYGTDLALQAQAAGAVAAVLQAPCEHWSDTPLHPPLPQGLRSRVARSAAVFERKWAHRLPVVTPCFDISAPGDVARSLETMG